MTGSCSFRITRSAEDMAHAINAFLQRVIELEQRQADLELKLDSQNLGPTNEEIKMLDGVDQVLRECQNFSEELPRIE